MNRDFRIDFLRGFVLLLIVADHVLNNEVSWFAFGDWLYFDGAAGFVFMSGLVCGMVYAKVVARQGWVEGQMKAVKRATQLYVAQIVVLAIACLTFMFFNRYEPLDSGPFGLAAMFEHPGRAVPNALLLMYSPWLMDILKLYIVLLLLLPTMLWVYQRSRLAAFGLSFAAYALAQKFPEITPREYPHNLGWFWNPLGWQFLFFGAAMLGSERARGGLRLPRNAACIAVAAIALAAVIALRRTDAMGWMWTDRQKLAPMHVASFALFAYLVSCVLRPNWAFWTGPIATPIIRCGRHSLPIFCIGVVIDYTVSMVLEPIQSHFAEAAIVAGGVGLTILAAAALEWLSNSRAAAAGAPEAANALERRSPLPAASRV